MNSKVQLIFSLILIISAIYILVVSNNNDVKIRTHLVQENYSLNAGDYEVFKNELDKKISFYFVLNELPCPATINNTLDYISIFRENNLPFSIYLKANFDDKILKILEEYVSQEEIKFISPTDTSFVVNNFINELIVIDNSAKQLKNRIIMIGNQTTSLDCKKIVFNQIQENK